MCGSPAMMKKSENDYQAEDDHRTLQRAEEVRADAGRMKRVAVHHRKKMGEMSRIGSILGKRKIARRPSMARSR